MEKGNNSRLDTANATGTSSSVGNNESTDVQQVNPDKSIHLPTGLPLNNKGKLDPQSLFELVSKHYDAWSSAIDKQFDDEENFSPFPSEDLPTTRNNGNSNSQSQPIFDYSLLEALDKVSAEVARDSEVLRNEMEAAILASTSKKEVETDTTSSSAPEPKANSPKDVNSIADKQNKQQIYERTSRKIEEIKRLTKDLELQSNQAKTVAKDANFGTFDKKSLLLESEMNYLQNKVLQIFKSNNVAIPKGFSLYDTEDEPGLHAHDGELVFEDGGEDGEDGHGDIQRRRDAETQDDYDIDEISDSMYSDYHPTHHIEVELNTDDLSGGSASRTVFNNQYDFEDDGGPSCEFTFEYDHTGKLVPTHNNVEEKLRLMSLQSRIRNGGMLFDNDPNMQRLHNNGGMPSSAGGGTSTGKKKKKKKKKNQGQGQHGAEHSEQGVQYIENKPNPNCCLFCEYETIYGMRPKQMIKWYDQKMKREEIRRNELRKKLENAKSKALKKQRELRQKQQQQLQELQQRSRSQEGVHEESKPPAPPDFPSEEVT